MILVGSLLARHQLNWHKFIKAIYHLTQMKKMHKKSLFSQIEIEFGVIQTRE